MLLFPVATPMACVCSAGKFFRRPGTEAPHSEAQMGGGSLVLGLLFMKFVVGVLASGIRILGICGASSAHVQSQRSLGGELLAKSSMLKLSIFLNTNLSK